MSLKREIFRGVVGGILLTLATISISFLQLRILLHYLPLPVLGVWLIFANFSAYVSFLDLGLTQTLGREVSFLVGQDLAADVRASRLQDLIRSCTRAVAVLAAGVYPLGAIVGWSYLKSITPVSQHEQLFWPWIVFFASATLNLLGQGWFAGLYGLGKVFAVRLLQTSTVVAGFILIVLAVLLRWGLYGMAWASLVQTVVSIAAAWWMLRGQIGETRSRGGINYALLRTLWAPGIKYAATVLGGVLILQTDNLVIASTLGTAVIPDYQAVAKIVTTLMTLSMMLVVTTSPFMSQAFAKNDIDAIRRLLQQNQRVSLSILVLLGSCVACFADRLIHLWLGPGHFIGFPTVWILLAMMLLEAHHVSMATATMSTGKIVFVVPALLAGFVNIGLSVFLAHRLGVVGVALGTLLAQLGTNNWYVPYYVLRQFGLSFRQHLSSVVGPIVLLLAATLGTGAILRPITASVSDFAALVVGCATTLAVGSAVVFWVVLHPSDRDVLLSRFRLQRLA